MHIIREFREKLQEMCVDFFKSCGVHHPLHTHMYAAFLFCKAFEYISGHIAQNNALLSLGALS